MVPDLGWFDLQFFFFLLCDEYALNFELSPFPGKALRALCSRILSRDAGQWQPQLPVS